MDDRREFRFEITRARYVAADEAPLFAGHELRVLAERECDPFAIRWARLPVAGLPEDVLVVEGSGPLPVVTALQAYVQGHDWRAVLRDS